MMKRKTTAHSASSNNQPLISQGLIIDYPDRPASPPGGLLCDLAAWFRADYRWTP